VLFPSIPIHRKEKTGKGKNWTDWFFLVLEAMSHSEPKTKRQSAQAIQSFTSAKPTAAPYVGRFENSDIEIKLRQKFQFFLQDLMRIASTANTALPMSVIDDRGSVISIQNFLKRNGPKFIFQFIQTNTENLSLLRSGLSVIIVCLSYLKRLQMELKLDENTMGGVDIKYQYITASQGHHYGMTTLQHKTALNHFLEEKTWVSQAISKINDSISVSSCMSIFVTTHDALAQELILNCVAGMMLQSDDSVVQMLTPPSIFNKSNRALDEKEKQQLLNGIKRPQSRADMLGSKSSSHLMNMSSNNLGGYSAEAAKASFRNENTGSRTRVFASYSQIPGVNTSDSGNTGSDNNITGGLGTSNTGAGEDRRASAVGIRDSAGSKALEDGMMNPGQHSCLSYMFAVAVLQKNRHSLLAAAAEVIILMAKEASDGLCESIAHTSTCALPLLSAVSTLSSNGGRRGRGGSGGGAASSKKFSATSYDDEVLLMPINPLTAGKVVDWAGIKVFLKFLHKYHSLMSTKDIFIDLLQQQHQLLVYEHPSEDKNILTAMAMNNLAGLRNNLINGQLSRIGSPLIGGLSVVCGAEEGELVTSSKMLSEDLQREFLMVHDRVFVALCMLIKGAPSIIPYILSLPGALDILRLSSIIFHERKSDNLRPMATDLISVSDSASPPIPSLQQQMDELEDAAVNIAMNSLQLEKQKQSRRHRSGNSGLNMSGAATALSLDHMIYAATGGKLLSSGANSSGGAGLKGGLTISLNDTGSQGNSSDGGMRHSHQHWASRGQSAPSPLARGFGNVKNQSNNAMKRVRTASTNSYSSSKEGSVHGKKLQPLGGGGSPSVSLSPVQIEVHSEPVTLAAADTHQKSANVHHFDTPAYAVQTETKALYKQNLLNRQQLAGEPASELQYLAVNRMIYTAQAPLQAPQSVDSLLDTSLQIIDREAKESLIHGQPQKDRLLQPVQTVNGRHPLVTDSVLNFNPSQSTTQLGPSTLNHASLSSSGGASPELPQQLRSSSSSPLRRSTNTNMAATKDFFGALPTKPAIPKRIEAQDAIIPQESMEVIRRKFQQVAAGALNQIKSSGTVFNNGKNALSLQERARRVYSPKQRSSDLSQSGPQLLAATSPVLPGRRPSSGLQPLNFLDEELGESDTMSSLTNQKQQKRGVSRSYYGSDSPAALERNNNNREGSEVEFDPEKTPAWNPRPEGLSYYGIRLDNVEFEEQDLFEHFKPIFGYEEHHENVADAEQKKNGASSNLYEKQQHAQGVFHATRGKIQGELEQTGDLLLL
jgi:hypothetical protein